MRSKNFWVFWLILILFWPAFVWGATETVRLPIMFDYQLIRSMLNLQSFTETGERAVLMGEKEEDCNHIELWGVEVSPEQSFLKMKSNIKIQAGAKVFGNCVKLVDWEGYIEVLQRVWVDEKTWQLRFETVSSQVFDKNGKPAAVAKNIGKLIKTTVEPFFDAISIDLSFPVNELKAFLPLLFSSKDRARVERWLNTMKLSKARVENDAVRLEILMEVETLPKPEKVATEELSPEKIDRLSKTWESWDAFLVYQIESLIGEPIIENERMNLFETLFETRNGFVRALTDKTMRSDLLREQFTWTWQRLATILRKYLVKQPSLSLLKYLAFFTASDALVALDKLGPTLGLEISRDGLLRLAQLLSKGGTEPVLDYSNAVSPELRKLLGLGLPLDESGPAFNVQEIDLPEELKEVVPQENKYSWRMFFSPLAFAAEADPAALEELKQWIPPKQNIQRYLDQVKQVLEKAAEDTLAKNQIKSEYQPLFRILFFTTAWQESCWRQFLKAGEKFRYLLSYNQSSVGLMQINERVWRGLYRPESLRWNINYNARAGSEILDYYLENYALKKMDPKNPLDMDTLARIVYAIYNGGPGEFKKFLKRKETNSFYQSDQLFWQKYTLAKEGKYDNISVCLVGK